MVCSHCWKVGTLVFFFSRFQMCAANIRATPRSNQQKWQRHEFNVEVLDLQCGYQHYSRLPAWLQDLHPLLCCDFKTPNLSQSNLPGQNWPLQSSAVSARFAGQGSGADTMNAVIYCWTEDVTQLLDDVLFQNRQPKVFCSWPHWTCQPISVEHWAFPCVFVDPWVQTVLISWSASMQFGYEWNSNVHSLQNYMSHCVLKLEPGL